MNSIPWYKSQVYVSALVAIVMQAGVILGISDKLLEADVTRTVEAIMQVIAVGSSAWTLIARQRSKVQPITLTAPKE